MMRWFKLRGPLDTSAERLVLAASSSTRTEDFLLLLLRGEGSSSAAIASPVTLRAS